jgi:hypothetical protein
MEVVVRGRSTDCERIIARIRHWLFALPQRWVYGAVRRWPMKGRRPRFQIGDRVVGREEGPASFRGRTGEVIARGPTSGEYQVRFDDGRTEHVMSSWIECA